MYASNGISSAQMAATYELAIVYHLNASNMIADLYETLSTLTYTQLMTCKECLYSPDQDFRYIDLCLYSWLGYKIFYCVCTCWGPLHILQKIVLGDDNMNSTFNDI